MGKTVVTAYMLGCLIRSGVKACVFKPVLSGAGGKSWRKRFVDIEFAMSAAGISGKASDFSVYAFRDAVSPHLAAEREGRTISLKPIMSRLQELQKEYEFIVVEGCGGVAVPMDRNGLIQKDIIKAMGFPAVIAASTGVGTLNHCILTAGYCGNNGIKVPGFIMSGCTDEYFEKDNLSMIKSLTGLPVLDVLPRFKGLNLETRRPGTLKDHIITSRPAWLSSL